jgi:nuclear pore complex protein Nup62
VSGFGAPAVAAGALAVVPAGPVGGFTSGAAAADDRIKKSTVGEIIDLWNQDLEEHVHSFTEQAVEVKRWDEKLMDSRGRILKLQHGVQIVKTYQEELDKKLEQLQVNQNGYRHMIERIEEHYRQAQQPRPTHPEELKRETAYRIGETVHAELQHMKESLSLATHKLNDNQGEAGSKVAGAPSNLLTPITRILNCQMESLDWIEAKSLELETRLHQAKGLLDQHDRPPSQQY